MNTLNLRKKLVEIAKRDVGKIETSRNHGEFIQKFWPATSYHEGYINREPYCAAAVCYWVREWLKDPAVLAALGMGVQEANAWRCKSAAAFGWTNWAKEKGLLVMSDSASEVLHTGDIMVFDISHVGIVDTDEGDLVYTCEANTGATGSRDGEGVFYKTRHRADAKNFIRLLL